MYKLEILESTIVIPSEETPKRNLWLTNLDLVFASGSHTPVLHIYKNNDAKDFFCVDIVKDALAKTLVLYYPLAGRYGKDKDGRFEVRCNGEGALFVVAHLDVEVDEFVEKFRPSEKMAKLILPCVESANVDPCIMAMFQLTFFKCGSVCLGTGTQHMLVDGQSGFHFIKTWSDIARGLTPSPPFLDKSLLLPHSPSVPRFDHPEFSMSPYVPFDTPSITISLSLNKQQVNTLKNSHQNISKFEAIAAHIWRTICIARGLEQHKKTQLYTIVDIRNRINPPLPSNYLGSALYVSTAIAQVGDLVNKSIEFGAVRIREVVRQVDDEHIRSLIDHLECIDNKYESSVLSRPLEITDIYIVSWFGILKNAHQANFGWGGPIIISRAKNLRRGFIVLRDDINGNVFVDVELEPETMEKFKHNFYAGFT